MSEDIIKVKVGVLGIKLKQTDEILPHIYIYMYIYVFAYDVWYTVHPSPKGICAAGGTCCGGGKDN